MATWQSLQDRPITNFCWGAIGPYGLDTCPDSLWHCWQSRGFASFSIASWFVPCGSWQFAQLSSTGW